MRRPTVIALLFLLSVFAVSSAEHEKIVCATPADATWMLKSKDGTISSSGLRALLDSGVSEWQGIKTYENWNLTGFYADILPHLMQNAGWSYKVKMYRTYTLALYATTKLKACDFTFASFTHKADRSNCKNVTSSDNIRPCKDLVDKSQLNLVTPQHACCAMFATPTDTSTVGLLVKVNRKHASLTLFEALLMPDMINSMCQVIILTIMFGHIVWFFERKKNAGQFPKRYLDGIDDGIWWATSTITTVGYGDKFPVSVAGRIVALIWMIISILLYGSVAGIMANSLAATKSVENIVTGFGDLGAQSRICTCSPIYPEYLKAFPFNVYVDENHGLQNCFDDMYSGKADAVFCDEPPMRYKLSKTVNMKGKFQVVPTKFKILLGGAFPQTVSSNENFHRFNQILMNFKTASQSQLLEIYNSYFPATDSGEDEISHSPWAWVYIVPAAAYIALYSIACFIDCYAHGRLDPMLPSNVQSFKVKTKGKRPAATSEKEAALVGHEPLRQQEADTAQAVLQLANEVSTMRSILELANMASKSGGKLEEHKKETPSAEKCIVESIDVPVVVSSQHTIGESSNEQKSMKELREIYEKTSPSEASDDDSEEGVLDSIFLTRHDSDSDDASD